MGRLVQRKTPMVIVHMVRERMTLGHGATQTKAAHGTLTDLKVNRASLKQ